MNYDFDEVIDRKNSNSLKYDTSVSHGKPAEIMPLWVADMDFRSPPCVIAALTGKSRHGIFGYSETDEDYFKILQQWFSDNFNWETNPDWLIKTPGVVFAICAAIRALTESGDAVLIQQPVYYPFASSVRANGRKLVVNQLLYRDHKYTIDFEAFEQQIMHHRVKLFILCSPHNPVGRVWTKEELTVLGDICLKHGVIVIADEIHADFTYPGYRHTVFSCCKAEFNDITVTCTAPTKTFNLAGLQISNIFVANPAIRSKINHELVKSGYSQLNIMGLVACQAAYREGHDWLLALREYLSANLHFVRNYLTRRLPQIKLVEPEGSYLVWLDFSELGLTDQQLDRLIVDRAGLWLDAGVMFGAGGEGFQRINIGCPRAVLNKALMQLEQALEQENINMN